MKYVIRSQIEPATHHRGAFYAASKCSTLFGLILILLVSQVLIASSPDESQAATTTQQTTATDEMSFPDNFMVNIKTAYGAKGDGITDDTAAIQRALDDKRVENGQPIHSDYYGRPKALYFPPGTYLVQDTLQWVGCCVALQGAGSSESIIKLKDGAIGFNNPDEPKPIIKTPKGNMSFRQNIWDMRFDTGKNNAGAVGLDYIANNTGSIRNVTITSGDGKGKIGLDMSRAWPGPLLIKNVRINGFDYGIYTKHAEYGPTLENITLTNQKIAGIFNEGNTLAIRNMQSTNSVPAITSTKDWASLIVLNSRLIGGASDVSAIESEGRVYTRNVIAEGYQSVVKLQDTVVPGKQQNEYVSDTIYSLFESPPRSLNLPIKETPTYHDDDMNNWGKFTTKHYGDTSNLQDLLNSGKSTIYFPFGGYFSYNERAVTVPASVKRIVGFSSVVNGDAKGENGGGIRFIVEENSTEPLIIEQFGYGIKVEHKSARPIAIKHGAFQYTAAPNAGDLYIEDVVMGNFRMQASQNVWARQYNNESKGTKIVNNGGNLWILGLKTERPDTVIETTSGGKTELLGTLIYPSRAFSDEEQQNAAFVNRDSSMSLIYSTSSYCDNCAYAIQVEETRDGQTRKLMSSEFPGRMPLYVGYKEADVQNSAPSVSIASPADGTTHTIGEKITITAEATDSDGNVTSVAFFAGDNQLGEDTVAPYCLVWRDTTAGTYALTAEASDNSGLSTTSAVVGIHVKGQPAEPIGDQQVFLPLIRQGNGTESIDADGCV